jgi:hypothetical protein
MRFGGWRQRTLLPFPEKRNRQAVRAAACPIPWSRASRHDDAILLLALYGFPKKRYPSGPRVH